MLNAVAIIIHAVVGWGLCGATVGVGRKMTTLYNALIAHAIAAPIIFGALSFVYFRWFGGTGPAATAAFFLAIVVFLDAFVVALLVEKSFDPQRCRHMAAVRADLPRCMGYRDRDGRSVLIRARLAPGQALKPRAIPCAPSHWL
ncbi:MAG TPA: hypothetical protein VKS24_22010 [Bradyrhizobium sp.]|nr:hypothetical protein [Bradyrhizobium sp.]